MKHIFRFAPLAVLAWLQVSVNAQSAVEAHVGLGTAQDKANAGGIENALSVNPFGTCTLSSNDGFCQSTPRLNGLFMDVGGSVMFNKFVGAGSDIIFRPSKGDYGPIQYRQTFIDGNLIFAPVTKKRWGLQLIGGIGSARTSFSLSQTGCVGTAVCTTQSQAIGAATHFQMHTGAGAQIFATEHIFVRPQIGVYYVPNLNQQFGSNVVTMMSVSVGFSSSRQ